MNESGSLQIQPKAKQGNQKAETLLKSKTTVEFNEKLLDFFYYQNHIICKGERKVIIYNTLSKAIKTVAASRDDFMVQFMPPYLFALIEGQFITLYDQNLGQGKPPKAKISKLEPLSICKFNNGYIMGGYNKSSFPGNKRSPKRLLYFISKINFEEKNKPDQTIKLKDNQCPVSKVLVQNPYLFAYARPTFYLISIQSRQTLITFEKDSINFLILQGRYAFSSLNGIGISLKNTIFTFDVERFPLYGVQVTEHLYTSECLCREKSGRIFGGHSNMIFEYHPVKKYSKCWALYPEGEYILSINCTPSNSLMALRCNRNGRYSIDVFGIDCV